MALAACWEPRPWGPHDHLAPLPGSGLCGLGPAEELAPALLLRRPFALGTAFVSSTVLYGNQVTSARSRAAADYITNQQKGLRCARLLEVLARTAAPGSVLLLLWAESQACFYSIYFRQSQTSV